MLFREMLGVYTHKLGVIMFRRVVHALTAILQRLNIVQDVTSKRS